MSTSIPGKLGWYARRLGRMSPAEIAWRIREQALRQAWALRQVRPDDLDALPSPTPALPPGERRFTAVLPPGAAELVPVQARAAIIADADRLLKGEWETLHTVRTDMERPDWFHDPVTGHRSPPGTFAFSLNQRDESAVGNIKQVWEVNRLQHLTLLAAAWYLTGKDVYAERVAGQLRSWWRENPFLSGVNWTSGIELGVRLINFTWIRRLLDDWPGISDLFERSDLAVRQIRWHQEYLAAFKSRGSSANNHAIAEAAGQLTASCAFPWFAESDRWHRSSALLFERSLHANTFSSGINRELASDYHSFVAELGIFAAIEAAASGTPVSDACWRLLCAMTDDMAALVDVRLRPPRQADSDEGRVVLLDAPAHNRWPSLLALGGALFGRLEWWPTVSPDAASVLASTLANGREITDGRPPDRPSRFGDAGITILRTAAKDGPEIWCRCDGGPHGFLSIAAHAHADALSVEVRCDGVDILADPGTYCYHGEPEWRSYFRSTVAHNTVELGGCSQSVESGPFMWQRQARTRELEASDLSWTAEHDGYTGLHPVGVHRRTVRLDPAEREIEISDVVEGAGHEIKLAFHLGPEVMSKLLDSAARLTWPGAAGIEAAQLILPGELKWSQHRGEAEPILGWYSPGLGRRVPAVTLLGRGHCGSRTTLITRLKFTGIEKFSAASHSGKIVSWGSSGAIGDMRVDQAEAI